MFVSFALACLDAYLPSPCVGVIKAELVANSAVYEVMQAARWAPLDVQVTQMTRINDLYVFWRIHWRKETLLHITGSLISHPYDIYESEWRLTRH